MKTKPLHRYLIVTSCDDPSAKLRKAGSLEIVVETATLDKNTNHVIPSLVLAAGPECTECKTGDVVHLNPNFAFNAVLDGRMVGIIHEQFCLAVLPKEDVDALGIKGSHYVPTVKADLVIAGPEALRKPR